MKDKIKKLLEAKREQRNALNKSMIECDSKEERAAIGETLSALGDEIAELEAMLAEIDEPAAASDDPANDNNQRSFNPAEGMQMRNGAQKKQKNVDKYDTEEYRTAFMNFCKRGVPIPRELRDADALTTTSDTSAVIPTTIINEMVREMKSYGGLYNAVRKLNVQGGVNIPILSVKPTATWITADSGTSESYEQEITSTSSVTFSYFGLECKVAQTLLVNVVTLEMFQSLFAELAVEAIIHALDLAIMNGSGSGEPTGITQDSNVPNANKITLTPTDFASWSAWKKKVFAKMKKSYRDGVFIMAQGTFDGYIDGMVDDHGQPIGRVNYGIDGEEKYRFGGKVVETVENDIIKDYDSASTGDVVAVFCKLSDYAINSNMQMQVVKWVDNDTNEIKNKVILIADGKLIDPYGVLLIKKGAATT